MQLYLIDLEFRIENPKYPIVLAPRPVPVFDEGIELPAEEGTEE